jgi:DNA mismatch endonuclease, patch repair protein
MTKTKTKAERSAQADPVRSRTMRAVRSIDTTPEVLVAGALKELGLRFRKNDKQLPGSPDFAITKLKKIIFVNGCFWHGHYCNRGARMPKINRDYWRRKILSNQRRDARVRRQLNALGWSVMTIWECQTRQRVRLVDRLSRRLKVNASSTSVNQRTCNALRAA